MCNASQLCIDKSKLCDKVRHCPMGDDEPISCGIFHNIIFNLKKEEVASIM